MSKPESKLEIVVSRKELDELPDDIVKIVLTDDGMEVNPKKKLYKYGIDAVLDLKSTQIKISPSDYSISIGKNSFYIHSTGLVRIVLSEGDIRSFHYGTPSKLMSVYRLEQEKKYLKEKTAHWEKYNEDKKRDKENH